jgi:hypothetical protein
MNKLKEAEINSVDFVKRGANQRADIKLYKSNDVVESAQSARRGVVDFFKNIFNGAESVGADMIAKGAVIAEFESCVDALEKSFESIIDSEAEPENKAIQMQKSVTEFADYISGAVKKWGMHKSVGKKIEIPIEEKPDLKKGEGKEMNNLDKLTPEEQEQYKKMQAKLGVADPKDDGAGKDKGAGTGETVIKTAVSELKEDTLILGLPATPTEITLPESVQKALDSTKEFIEKSEKEEVKKFVEKYAVLGEDTDKLADDLYELKKSSSETYDKTIAILDKQVELIEKSGIFAEIGKSGAGNVNDGKAETIAKGLMEKNPELTYHQAMEKAFDSNPELITEYDN